MGGQAQGLRGSRHGGTGMGGGGEQAAVRMGVTKP